MKKSILITLLLFMILNSSGQCLDNHIHKHNHSKHNEYQLSATDSKDSTKNIVSFTPLFVFFLGLLLIPLTDKLKKNNQLKMLELYFNELVNSLHQQLTKQTAELQKCIENINNYDQNSYTLTRISGYSLSNLDKINNEDLFRIYILRRKERYKDRITDFKNLNVIIGYFKEALPHLFKSNEKAIELYDRHRIDWNSSQDRIVNIYNNLVTTNNANSVKKGDDEYYDTFCNIFNTFFDKYGNDLCNIKTGFEEFVNPLIDFARDNSGDIRSYNLLSALQPARHSYLEMITIREDHRDFLQTTYTDIIDFNEKLITLIEKLRIQKVKLL